jgi:hypothetical protein
MPRTATAGIVHKRDAKHQQRHANFWLVVALLVMMVVVYSCDCDFKCKFIVWISH